MNSMLHIDEDAATDDSIQSYRRFAFQPINGTNYNNASPIVIRVENSDSYSRPSDSEIEFEGQVVKSADGEAFPKAEANLALINNGIMYLFDNIKYELSSIEIDSVYLSGQTTTHSHTYQYLDSAIQRMGWLKIVWELDNHDNC